MKLVIRKNKARATDEDPEYIVTQKQRLEDDTGYIDVQVGTGIKQDWPSNGEEETVIVLSVEITKSTYSKK